MKYISKKLFLLPLLSLLISAVVYPNLPEQIPIHFSFDGTPDNYGGRAFIFVVPLISLICTIMAEILPRMDPKQPSYDRFPKTYGIMHFCINVLFLAVTIALSIYSLGYEFNTGYIISAAVGILISVVGNYMPKMKQNFFTGIKTPWTVMDEENWNKTHRLGGKLWLVGGLVFIILPFLPESLASILIAVDLIILVIIPYAYSYLLYKKKYKL